MKIKDIGTVITGKTPLTSHPEYYNGHHMFITPNDLHGGYHVKKSEKSITDAGLQSIARSSIEGASVLVGCIGWDMGNVAMCFEKCATNQQINSITNIRGYNPHYLYYWLSTKKKYLFSIASITRTPILSKSTFEEVEVPSTPIEEQEKIVNVLLAIDKKIALNQMINDNLQQQLKLLYDYWFTQFDFPNDKGNPYRASGGAMVWNEELQKEIPLGWECRSLGDLLVKNSTPFDYKKTEPTVDLSVMPSSSIALCKLNESDMFSTNLFIMKEGDILFGSIRPYLKKAGIAPCDGVFAGTIHSYIVKNAFDYNFALFTMCRDAFFDYAARVSTGTKMPVISNENLLAYKVAYSAAIAERFNKIEVKNIICKNVQESLQLTVLRDWLLPMLMNGQATVSD